MSNLMKEIYQGFITNPIATLCVLLVAGFVFVYNDLRCINAEQRAFMTEMSKTQQQMNESLQVLNVRMGNIEQNFQTTPQQLKELILLLHKDSKIEE